MVADKLKKLVNSGWTVILSRGASEVGGELIMFPGSKANVEIMVKDEIIFEKGDDIVDLIANTVERLFDEDGTSVVLRPDKICENGSAKFIGANVERTSDDVYPSYISKAFENLTQWEESDIEDAEYDAIEDDQLLEDPAVFRALEDMEHELGLMASELYTVVKDMRKEGKSWEELSDTLGCPEDFLTTHYYFLLRLHSEITKYKALEEKNGDESS